MVYVEYLSSGKDFGKVLRQLSKIGVPIRIVSCVKANGENEITYLDKTFATYKYNDKDIPIFKFHEPYESFRKLGQPVMVEETTLQSMANKLKDKFHSKGKQNAK
jgi:hypothetical protein